MCEGRERVRGTERGKSGRAWRENMHITMERERDSMCAHLRGRVDLAGVQRELRVPPKRFCE